MLCLIPCCPAQQPHVSSMQRASKGMMDQATHSSCLPRPHALQGHRNGSTV
eukprot:m.209434 g.209434  ORF g.209434 m.209434 type:complete len:51 (+) comp24600_c0_seq1:178-330(+)